MGGTKKPLFVIATDVDKNIVYVGEGKDHPGCYVMFCMSIMMMFIG